MIDIQAKKIIETYNTDALFALKNKSKEQIVVEKFLLLQIEKTKQIMSSLANLLAKREAHWKILRFTPIICLLGYFLPDKTFDFVRSSPDLSRSTLWLMINIALMPFFIKRSKKALVLRIIATFFAAFLLPEADLDCFFGSPALSNIFVFQTLFAVASVLLWRRLLKKEQRGELQINKQVQDEIYTAAQKALNVAHLLRGEELKKILEDYAPELDSLIRSLKFQERNVRVVASARKKGNMILPVHLGQSASGEKIYIDLREAVSIGIGGVPGSGKSNFLNHLITGFLDKENIQIKFIDPEGVEGRKFAPYSNVEFVEDTSDALEMLGRLEKERERRKRLFAAACVGKIDDFNKAEKQALPSILLIIDELADFASNKDFSKLLSGFARKGRKWGIHCILATQRPDAKTFDAQVVGQISHWLAFQVRDKNNAKIVSAPGAENIRKTGEAIYVGGKERLKIQTPLAGKLPRPKKKVPPAMSPAMSHGMSHDMDSMSCAMSHSMPCDMEKKQKNNLIQVAVRTSGAEILSYDELKIRLGSDPRKLGFKGQRWSSEGVSERGYWVMEK